MSYILVGFICFGLGIAMGYWVIADAVREVLRDGE